MRNKGLDKGSVLNSFKYHNVIINFFVAISLAIFSSTYAYNQNLNTNFYQVQHDELSDKFVWCIAKDSQGFMWFGTTDGLYRYDGTNIKTYRHLPDDSTSICHNNISDIIEDHQGNLWIGTSAGVALYNREYDNFIDINSFSSNEFVNAYITCLGADENDHIWAGTRGGGVNIYHKRLNKFTFFYGGNDKGNYVASDHVLDVLIDGGKTWVASSAGLKVYDNKTLQPISVNFLESAPIEKEITNIIKDEKNNIWLSTIDGEVYLLEYHNNRYLLEKKVKIKQKNGAPSYIKNLAFEGANKLWITTNSSGLKSLDLPTNNLTHYRESEGDPYSIPSISIRSLYVDNQGLLWFGTYNKGVYFLDKQSNNFQVFQKNPYKHATLMSNSVNGFTIQDNRYIWIATGEGLNKFDIDSNSFIDDPVLRLFTDSEVIAVLYDSHNRIWVGTKNEGVFSVNLTTREVDRFNVVSSGTGNNNVLTIFEDKKKKIWVGTYGSGLFYYKPDSKQFILLNEKEKSNYLHDRAFIYSIFEDSDSTIWVGTGYGLYSLKRAKGDEFNYSSFFNGDVAPNNLSSYSIQEIHEDSKGRLWFGTFDNGLNLWVSEQEGFRSIQPENDETITSIRGIIEDDRNNLWVSSTNGLYKYNPEAGVAKRYTKLNGLTSNNFNINSNLKLKSGRVFFGGNNGFILFHPDSVTDNPNPPKMWLSDFKINNQEVVIGDKNSPLTKHIGLTQHVSLSYAQRSFSIDFIGINYGLAAENQYCYMLEGFDKEWNCIGQNHNAVYTNLDPGNYVFLAKGKNNDGVWSDTPARLEISIRAPHWRSWWAILIYVMVIASILFIIYKIRIERLKIMTQLNFEKMAREKEHELTLSKTRFFTNISHELRTPLSAILIPVENLVSSINIPKEARKSMIVAHKNLQYLIRLVNQLMDFSKMDNAQLRLQVRNGELVNFISDVAATFASIRKKKNINLTIDSNESKINGWFDSEKIKTILLNILSNAFKFTQADGQVRINIEIINQQSTQGKSTFSRLLSVTVIDSGVGINSNDLPRIFTRFYQSKSSGHKESPGTGIGLSLAKELLELHHGSINVESTENIGSAFTVIFPIDREAYQEDEIIDTPIDVLNETDVEHENIQESNADCDQERSTILIVEDNDELSKLLVTEFTPEYTVIESVNGQDGIDKAVEKSPDLIISDVIMPQKTGFDLCTTIKSDLRTSHIPVILLTAKAEIDDQVAGVESDADLYITKPFSIRLLKSQVKQIIISRKKLYAHFSQDAYLLPHQLTNNEIDEKFLKQVIDLIHENILNDQLNIESIAGPLNLSNSQFYKKIKALTGKTGIEFIRDIRLKYALKLMETRKYTLAEIAYQAGFSSPSYFTRSFKEQFGKPPSVYNRN